MALAEDLLEQARHLANRERRRPKQASLRRAVSAAYYALFHLLAREAGRLVVPGSLPADLRHLVVRAHNHGEMKRAAKGWITGVGALPRELQSVVPSFPEGLNDVAASFVALQELRHEADYNTAATFGREEVLRAVERAERAFDRRNAIRKNPVAATFLLSLLFGGRFIRRSN